MQLPIVRLVFDRKKEADDYKSRNPSRKGLLQIEIYHERKRKYFSTGVKLYRGQWHDVRWVVNHPNSHNLNAQLKMLVARVNDSITIQMETNGSVSMEELERAVSLEGNSELVSDAIDSLYGNYVEEGKSYSSYMQYSALKSLLSRYGRIVRICDLTLNAINDLDRYMKTKEKYGSNTICNYHAKLKRVCNVLVSQGRLKSNPYSGFTIVKPKDNKIRYLSEEELEAFRKYPFEKPGEKFVQDFCLFQSMTGLSYSDAVRIRLEDIREENGRFVVIDHRVKTAEQYSIVILPQAMEILRRNGGNLDRYCLQHINTCLYHMGMRAINRKITTHMMRHTFSIIALRHGVPIEYVSKMLGHTNIQTTQRYAKVLARDVIDQFDKLDGVFSK